MGTINKLAIFCGSKKGNNEMYERHAIEIANLMAERKIELIYGGGRNGIMGVVADTVLAAGGIVRGVIPRILTDWEHQHEGISELMVVDDMHIRKRKLYELSDAAIILPGGFGTLDELFEILTWNQLSIHDKRIFLLNTSGFYTHLIEHMKTMQNEGFLYGELEEKIILLQEPKQLVSYL